jgi:2-polyprenyl-3-methyl-5-hydroxy-6-metoxy-1,4-benzoquinol methylase
LPTLEDRRVLKIIEIGCGGGDNLKAISKYLDRHGYSSQLTGVDINPECINFARAGCKPGDIDFICSDYKKLQLEEKPDIIFSSLFCHHFTDEDLVFMLNWMKENVTRGFFINDLHRHPLAYYSIQFLTRIFSKSRLVKNDAPLSVQRGFKKKDWNDLFRKAGLIEFECNWHWAFRWLVIYKNNGITS